MRGLLAIHATSNKLRLISKEISLYRYIPAAREAKAHLDNVIDLCGTPPKGVPKEFDQEIQLVCSLQTMFTGTGLQNLRECIVWTKQKFDFEPKVKKPFWKRMSVNFIERYCYLICFATYLKEEAPKGTSVLEI